MDTCKEFTASEQEQIDIEIKQDSLEIDDLSVYQTWTVDILTNYLRDQLEFKYRRWCPDRVQINRQ